MATTYLTGNEAFVKDIVSKAIPGYTGRKYKLETAESVDVRSYWDGGSRDYFAFVRVTGEGVSEPYQVPQQSAFDRPLAGADSVKLDSVPGLVCVRHTIFQGKDLGVTLMVHPSMLNAGFLPAKEDAGLSDNERTVLRCTRTYKSSYGGISNYRQSQSGLSMDAWNAAKDSLIGKGLLDKRGALTVKGRNAAQGL